MTRAELLRRLADIKDTAYWGSGCSHDDALQSALEEVEEELASLIVDVSEDEDNE